MKQSRKKVFFLLVTLFAFYALVEILLAVTGLSKSPSEKIFTDVYDYAYELVPNVEFPMGNDPSVIWKVNRHGFRGPEINIKKPEDTFRIICVGDSTTAGHFLNYDQTYCAKLQNKLNGKIPGYRKVQTINAGVPGTAITQQNHTIRKKILRFLPDMIVLYVVPSLSSDLVALHALKEKTYTVPKTLSERIKRVIRRFHIYRFARRIIKGDVRTEIRSNMEIIKQQIDKNADFEKNRLALFEKDLQEFETLCRSANVEPVLVQNVTEAVSHKLAEQGALPGTEKYSEYFSSPEAVFIEVVKDYAKRKQVDFLDPYASFVPVISDSKLFFEDGVHPSEEGHELLAELIAGKIIKIMGKR